MSIWDTYQERCDVRGDSKRQTQLNRAVHTIRAKEPTTLSHQIVTIYPPEHGYNLGTEEAEAEAEQRELTVIDSDNMNEKRVIALPGDELVCGALVCWMGQYWLISEADANLTLNAKTRMLQCNHLLRWVNERDEICEQWCIIEDGTKYLTGEYEDRNFVVTRGDSRISMMLARNAETVKLGRSNRFIIDDPGSPAPLAYTLTKPLKLGWTYQDRGVFKFVLQESTTTVNDNLELRIADYYQHFPRETESTEEPAQPANGKKVWL